MFYCGLGTNLLYGEQGNDTLTSYAIKALKVII
ncbi:hypothetical protein [Proteus mirabilis]|nr:hypothetical protein [Proteus mirabilis]